MASVPDYDDTDMTNEDFEAAVERSVPVDLLVAPMAYTAVGWGPSGATNQGARAVVETAGFTVTSPTTSFAAAKERETATV